MLRGVCEPSPTPFPCQRPSARRGCAAVATPCRRLVYFEAAARRRRSHVTGTRFRPRPTAVHCQPRLFYLGKAPACQYNYSTQAVVSYKDSSSSMSFTLCSTTSLIRRTSSAGFPTGSSNPQFLRTDLNGTALFNGTAHGDEAVGPLGHLGREQLGPAGTEVDSLLQHHLRHDRVDPIGGHGPGGGYVDGIAGIMPSEGLRHLAPA